MNTNSNKHRGLFYHRDSGGRHEMTPGQYVEWAQRRAAEFDVSFAGTPERIADMIRTGKSVDGDLFLDYDVSGNTLSRIGLDAMFREAECHDDVTHIFIPRRDRLARPDDAADGMRLETRLRKLGKCLVFTTNVCLPLAHGRRADIGEMISSLVEYHDAGKFRRDLAEKMIYAQIALARAGFSTGGRPPYGFRRWLTKDNGTLIRQLADGECVRMAGHHVVWLPGPAEELDVIRRILNTLKTIPASRVAKMLTEEKAPPPDSGRFRKRRGVPCLRSDVWYAATVNAIARNPLLVAVAQYGRRSMGDQFRFSKDGPRELSKQDYREDNKPKVIINPPEKCIVAETKFEPLIAPAEQQELIRELDRRGGSQRGKPRSRTPGENPMGTRIFDLSCGWTMYREPYNGSFRYKCGLYQQSHGQQCRHNHVDGLLATKFTLSIVRQKLLKLLPQVEQRLRDIAAIRAVNTPLKSNADEITIALATLQDELKIVSSNLARAKSDAQYQAVSTQFDQLKAREASLKIELGEAKAMQSTGKAEIDVKSIIDGLEKLLALASDKASLKLAGEAIQTTNAKLFLAFDQIAVKKRTLNRITGGVVTLGDGDAPIEVFKGPTARDRVKLPSGSPPLPTLTNRNRPIDTNDSLNVSDREGKSLGNVNRADWI